MQHPVHGLAAQEQSAHNDLYGDRNRSLQQTSGQQHPEAFPIQHRQPKGIEHNGTENVKQHNSRHNGKPGNAAFKERTVQHASQNCRYGKSKIIRPNGEEQRAA